MNDILNKIIAECPKAWAEWCGLVDAMEDMNGDMQVEHNEIRYMNIHAEPDHVNFRNWYDYFDKKNIRILICYGLPSADMEYGYYGEITDFKTFVFAKRTYYSRTEAEWNAFLEAFKIREGQL